MMNPIKLLKTYQADVVLALAVVLISVTAFNLGKISALNKQKTPVTITEPETADKLGTIDYGNLENQNQTSKLPVPYAGSVVVSKNSVGKVYHFPWCPGASKIADRNKLTFTSETAAISAGYTLAGNCTR